MILYADHLPTLFNVATQKTRATLIYASLLRVYYIVQYANSVRTSFLPRLLRDIVPLRPLRPAPTYPLLSLPFIRRVLSPPSAVITLFISRKLERHRAERQALCSCNRAGVSFACQE